MTRRRRGDHPRAKPTGRFYGYDQDPAGFYNVGRLTTAATAVATLTYDYDKDGRLTRQTWVVGTSTYVETIGRDLGGRVLWFQYPDGTELGNSIHPFVYDGAGRFKSSLGASVQDTPYNARGQLTFQERGNILETANSYSAARGWLTGILSTGPGATHLSLAYTRDAGGRGARLSSVRSLRSPPHPVSPAASPCGRPPLTDLDPKAIVPILFNLPTALPPAGVGHRGSDFGEAGTRSPDCAPPVDWFRLEQRPGPTLLRKIQ